ncbi:MAG: hypothetical protein WCK90_04385 [archaeon]
MADAPDMIDYTLLHKRGLLKLPDIKSSGKVSVDKEGFVSFNENASSELPSSSLLSPTAAPATDFWSMGTNTSPVAQTSSVDTSSPFGFLDNAASASPSQSYFDSQPSLSASASSSPSDLNALRIKLEDTEYKLERALERLAILESKINIG